VSFHLPHKPRRARHRVITPAGDPVAPRDAAYFRSLHADVPAPVAPVPGPAHVPTGPERRAALVLRAPVPPRAADVPRTSRGVRIVSSFFADPDFADPLREFVRTVHRDAAEMAREFDRNAARIEYEHDLDTHFAAQRRDGAAMAAAYAQGGTENMAGLVEQVRARIVDAALNGGSR